MFSERNCVNNSFTSNSHEISTTPSAEASLTTSSNVFSSKHFMSSNSLSQKRNRRYFAVRPKSSSAITISASGNVEQIKDEFNDDDDDDDCIDINEKYRINDYFNEDDIKPKVYYKRRRIDTDSENNFSDDYQTNNKNGQMEKQRIKEEKTELISSMTPLFKNYELNALTQTDLSEIWTRNQPTDKNINFLNIQTNSPTSASTPSRDSSPISPVTGSPSSSGIGSSANTSATTSSERSANLRVTQSISPPPPSSVFTPPTPISNLSLPHLLELAKTVGLNVDSSSLANAQTIFNSVINGQKTSPCSSKHQTKLKFSIDDILQSEDNSHHREGIDSSIPSSLPIDSIPSLLAAKLGCSPPSTSTASALTTGGATTSTTFFDNISNKTFSVDVSPTSAPEVAADANRFPAWIFCTRYSDRPSSGSRSRKTKRKAVNNRLSDASSLASPTENENSTAVIFSPTTTTVTDEEKRPRTAFTTEQLERLKQQFIDSRYLTEKRRQELAHELGLNESQIKIWFQNKRAKLKKNANTAATISHTTAQPPKQLTTTAAMNAVNSSLVAIQLIAAQGLYRTASQTH